MKYKYLRGSKDSREAVEFDIIRRGRYVTTCVVNVDLLMSGVMAAPCGNGDDYKLTPEERLEILELALAERKKIAASYPVKTYAGWQASGLRTFEDYCFPGDEVDEEMVDYFINSVPPILLWPSCTQAWEPFNHEKDDAGQYRPTYTTFHRLGNGRWQFDGYCYHRETKNRVLRGTRLEQIVREEGGCER